MRNKSVFIKGVEYTVEGYGTESFLDLSELLAELKNIYRMRLNEKAITSKSKKKEF